MTLELLAMAIAVATLDQGSKAIVTARLAEGQSSFGRLGVGVRHSLNRRPYGASGRAGVAVSWVVTVLGALVLASMVPAFQGHGAQISFGAALGGATGNAFDRLARQGVVDFIDLRVWPVFNVADAGIVAGVIGILWSLV